MELQSTLTGRKVNNNTTNLGVFSLSRKLMLKMFYKDCSDLGLSLVELRKLLGHLMCENTLQSSLTYLKNESLISLAEKNKGPTKRRKYYKITERGALTMPWGEI